jgi:hypothetical protein
MKRNVLILLWIFLGLHSRISAQIERAPSYPLVAHDPYFSIWSPADRLYDRETVHWTGSEQPLHSMLRIDGKCYRIMGSKPSSAEPLPQTDALVYPTRTIYKFRNEIVALELRFTTPALFSDPDILSRPVTYISWRVIPLDGKDHNIQVYFDCGGEIAVNTADQAVVWNKPAIEGLNVIRLGSKEQPVLKKKGDNLRIDWGYAYLGLPVTQNGRVTVNSRDILFRSFSESGQIPDKGEPTQPLPVREGHVTMAGAWDLGKVGSSGKESMVMLAYDDISSILYFSEPLHAWWKRSGMTMDQLLPLANKEYGQLEQKCKDLDVDLMKDLRLAGGDKYASMCALVYRQCLAAQKLVADPRGKPLLFPKENFSNGCIASVDVLYPASPVFFLFSPALSKAMLEPVFQYSESSHWKFDFAPHDLGQYPHATGQVYGGAEKTEEDQMPVEETGNMIIMTAAVARMEGNASFAWSHWKVLEKWSNYLLSKGFDPENQLCTDDFAGHLAHNINLSAKAIIALGSYALLCDMNGDSDKATKFRKQAEEMAAKWIARASEGTHTRLAFDRPGTWSQKYNLVWDKILGLHLFPDSLLQSEIAFYKTMQAEYGLPLDNRERYTKNDWITWSATLADNEEDFECLFNHVYDFAIHTPQRVPVSDWYITDNAFQAGFQARSVVGGFFVKMLSDPVLWQKWVSRATAGNGNAAQDSLLTLLTGKWVLKGTIAGQQTTHDIQCDWVLGHQYIQFSEVSREKDNNGNPSYEAKVFITWNKTSKLFDCLWLDNTGNEGLKDGAVGHSAYLSNRLEFIFSIADGSHFFTTFNYDKSTGQWQLLMDGEAKGRKEPFARLSMERE